MDTATSPSGVPHSPMSVLCILGIGLQWTVYVISSLWRTEKFFDITGSATFIILTYLSYKWSIHSLRQKIQAFMVITWAMRLGLFLFIRVLKTGKDRRFDKIKDNPSLFFFTWTLQGVWVLATLCPTLLLMAKPQDYPFSDRDYVGYSLWLIGFGIEVVADFQKSMFRNDPRNKGRFIARGLWSFSRHPNYLGEILLWFGMYLSASSVFTGREALCVLCPVFDMVLITKLSGIPPLEKYGLMKWGQDPNYIRYLRNTSLLIPCIW